MVRHYHIITCDDEDILDSFVNKGMVGIRPVIKGNLTSTVRMNWDILADIARVKEGDYILLHTKGIIQGVFEVTSNPIIEQNYVQLFDAPNIVTNNWRNNWSVVQNIISQNRYIWWIPIQPVKNLFFEKMSMDVIFQRIAEGIITSLPQRLRYEDKNKTVKGLTKTDFEKIIRLFHNYSHKIIPQNKASHSFKNIKYIEFDFLTNDAYEKNIEAIIVHKVRSNTMKIAGLNFSHTNILNTVPLGYLKMADILTWAEENEIINPWIWELKVNSISNYNELKDEIRKLSVRASYVSKLLQNGYKITGIILAKGFSSNVVASFSNIIIPIGSLEEIVLISYNGTGRTVNFNLVVRK